MLLHAAMLDDARVRSSHHPGDDLAPVSEARAV
jgi:hypothetical protein